MHELGIVFHIIRTVEDVARQNDVAHIRRVTLQLGEVSGVVESYLQDCWKWAAAKSEILPGAELAVESIPAVTVCDACGQQYPTVQYGRICPHCRAEEFEKELPGKDKHHQRYKRHDGGTAHNSLPLLICHSVCHGQKDRHCPQRIGQRKERSKTK